MVAAWEGSRGATRGGSPLPPATLYARLGSNHSHSHARSRAGGVENFFDSAFQEILAPELHWGALPGLELSLRRAFGGWEEVEDRFEIRDAAGNPIVRFEDALLRGEASRRHTNPTRVDFGSRISLLDLEENGAASLGVTLKIPVAPQRDLSNAGTNDISLTLLETLDPGEITIHGNAGLVVPLTDQNLFTPQQNIDLDSFAHGALAAGLRLSPRLALNLQVEANSSAFRSVSFLKHAPVSLVGGVRKLSGGMVLEAGVGLGLNSEASYGWMFFLGVGQRF